MNPPRMPPSSPSGLSPSETRRLIARSQAGNDEATETLVEANLKLVAAIVRRFPHQRDNYDDLFQSGCVGLMKAIEGFDLAYSVAFSSYAVPHILGEIRRFIRQNRAVKVSRSMLERSRKIIGEKDRLSQDLGRSPTVGELAEAVELPREDVIQALESTTPAVSLHAALPASHDDEGQTWEDILTAPSPSVTAVEQIALGQLLARLPSFDRTFVVLRFIRRYTQAEVADFFGCSQAKVSRMEKRLRDRLKLLWEQ